MRDHWEQASQGIGVLGTDVVERLEPHRFPVIGDDLSATSLTESSGVVRDRVEDWLDIRWRTGDYPQDLTRRRLLLLRLNQLAVAGLELPQGLRQALL
jgi:hypothetical protein